MCGGGGSEPTPAPAPTPEPVKPAPVPEPTPAPTPAPAEPSAPAAPSAPVAAGGTKKGAVTVSSIKQGLMSTVRNVQQRGKPVLTRKSKVGAASMFDKSTKDLLGQ